MRASANIVKLAEHTVGCDAPFDIDYPELAVGAAICVGLSIDWRHMQALHAFAMRHTHNDERQRAARFLHPEDGLRHLLGRALLRSLAIRYGGMAAEQAIALNPFGKPEPTVYPVGTSLSHAGTQIWAAIARFPHVGIDVESAVAPDDYRDIMRSFHPDEVAALQTCDAGAALMRCWNRKEAVAKAVGMGLSLPLHHYAVDCGPVPHDWLRIAPPTPPSTHWTTVDLPIADGYVGALAIAGRCDSVTAFRAVLA